MEVLVLAANAGAGALFDGVLTVLQTSVTPIQMVSTLPGSSAELQDHQLIVSRKRLDRDSLSAIIGNETVESSADLNTTATSATERLDTSQLLRKIGRKSKKIKLLTEQVDSFKAKAQDAMQKAQHLEMEQEQFLDDVQEMKAQFDKLGESHRKLMWEYLPARDPSLRSIPRLSAQLQETPTTVGKYPLEQVLGYGQYAVVYTSSTPERPNLAIKAIDKQKLVDLVSLHRISSEIASLRDPAIRHPGILELMDVIHTHHHVYLVTERGGKDLFEFFGARDEGLEEDTIRPLLRHLAQAVEVLHRNNYCHRDLKPENVLYTPDNENLVKLIDFGLCTKAPTKQERALHDFCGSPGFFAPELLLQESYDGLKADIWSIGCILLELALGNTVFSSIWMSMYELSTLQQPAKFAESVQQSLARTRDFCHGSNWKYSSKLRSALLGMLCENPSERFSISQVLDHPWLASDSPQLSRSAFSASHSDSRKSSSIKTKIVHSPSLGDSNPAVHPLCSTSADYPTSAPGSPRSHHIQRPSSVKLSLPSLSPEKPPTRCSPERNKLAFGVARVQLQ